MRPKRPPLYNPPRAIATGRYDAKWRIPSPDAFRTWLVRARRACSPVLTQRELGALCGLTAGTIQQIERARREPTLEVAHRIWRVLHAAYQGKLWIGIQVRRDNQGLTGHPRARLAEDEVPVKLRKLTPDPTLKP
jgi:DNA-binding XRE family transcriptional regulator